MAKTTKGGMHGGKNRKLTGRASIGKNLDPSIPSPTSPARQKTQSNRGATADSDKNKHRGDRRDMSKYYTGNENHAARGNNPRKDVSTRAR
jgi:hypothetical protein